MKTKPTAKKRRGLPNKDHAMNKNRTKPNTKKRKKREVIDPRGRPIIDHVANSMWPRFTVKGEEIIEDKRWARELGEQLQVNTWLPMDLGLPSRSCPRSWRRADTGGIITKVSFGVYTRQEHPKLPSPSLLVGRQVTMPCGTKWSWTPRIVPRLLSIPGNGVGSERKGRTPTANGFASCSHARRIRRILLRRRIAGLTNLSCRQRPPPNRKPNR